MNFVPLTADALPAHTAALARALIGCVLVRESPSGRAAGRIVETEAYLPGDRASHAFAGKTPRNASMFFPPFHAYIYQIYGVYFCFNVSSEREGQGAGVLIRALEPLEGLALMRRRRGVEPERDLCRGPGRLCQALGIDRSLDGSNLLDASQLWLARAERTRGHIGRSTRIGIRHEAQRLHRFYERGSPFVSGPRFLSP